MLSLAAFAFLDLHWASRALRGQHRSASSPQFDDHHHLHHHGGAIDGKQADEALPLLCTEEEAGDTDHDDKEGEEEGDPRRVVRCVAPMLLCQVVLAALAFAVIPSIMPFLYKKYAVRRRKEAARRSVLLCD